MSFARFLVLCTLASAAIAAMWLPWQQSRCSYEYAPEAAISTAVSAWSGLNPLVGILAAATLVIAWIQWRHVALLTLVARISVPGVGLIWVVLLFINLVLEKSAAPGIGLGVEVLSFGFMFGIMARTTDTAVHAASIRPWKVATSAIYVAALLLAVVYVPPDDVPRRGISGWQVINGTRVGYGLDDSGLVLVVISGKDMSCRETGRDGTTSWSKYSCSGGKDVRVEWTNERAVVGNHQFDLSSGRVLHLSSVFNSTRVTQLALKTRPLSPTGRFRWSHYGVKDELERILDSEEVKAAIRNSING